MSVGWFRNSIAESRRCDNCKYYIMAEQWFKSTKDSLFSIVIGQCSNKQSDHNNHILSPSHVGTSCFKRGLGGWCIDLKDIK